MKGFSKIEIIIVILVIVLLLAGDYFLISYLNKKTQDIKVLSEVSQIRSSLEVYLNTNNFYPEKQSPELLNDPYNSTEKLCLSGFKRSNDDCEKHILKTVPNAYLNKGNAYTYQSINNNKNYLLEFNLLTNFKDLGLLKGKACADNLQITSQPCF